MIQVVPIGYTIYDSRGSTTLWGQIGERFFEEHLGGLLGGLELLGSWLSDRGGDMGAVLRAANGKAYRRMKVCIQVLSSGMSLLPCGPPLSVFLLGGKLWVWRESIFASAETS